MHHILTALVAWRDRLTAALPDLPDRLLAQLASDLRQALTAVEAERTHRQAAYQGERERARLYRQRER